VSPFRNSIFCWGADNIGKACRFTGQAGEIFPAVFLKLGFHASGREKSSDGGPGISAFSPFELWHQTCERSWCEWEINKNAIPPQLKHLAYMKKTILLLTAALPFLLSSCTTPAPRQAYHNTDNSALIVESLDGTTCSVLSPTTVKQEDNGKLLDQAKNFSQHQTAVVILENYSEPQLGHEFRDRTMGWFIGLRGLGYQHIIFLKGTGANDPNGLLTLAEYD
jgi:hypothetical protein